MSLTFPVSPEKNAFLKSRMQELGISENDLHEIFTRSVGHGGQNVNKVSTAVHLKHRPSGIEVKCSVYRTQGLNRYKARAILCEKMEFKGQKSNPKIEKIIKNKKKKRQKQKKKVLEELRAEENLLSIREENLDLGI